jgi:hypothetical protein
MSIDGDAAARPGRDVLPLAARYIKSWILCDMNFSRVPDQAFDLSSSNRAEQMIQ